MKLIRKLGATSQILQIFIADSSSTTGAGLPGLTNASSGLTAYYHRDTDTTATAISLVSMTVGTFTSSGFKEIDSTNMPGWYQFCPPNAALASGAASVVLHFKGATNMAPLPIEIDLDAQVDVTSWNGTAVSAPATAGIPDVNAKNWNNLATVALPLIPTVAGRTLDVSAGGEAGLDWANIGSPTTTVALTGTTVGTVTTVTNQLTAAAIATGVWQDTTAGDFTVASSIGKSLYTSGVVPGGSGGLLISGANSGTTTLGALTVSGATTLAAISGTTLTLSGAVAFQSTFAVTTSTSLAALSCSTFTASGAVAFQSTFGVTGAVTFSSTFATTGTTTFNAFTVTNALTVSGATTFTGAWTATNAGNNVTGVAATVSGTVSANVTQINSVSTSSVTAVNANIGLTQPLNFTGTGASALAKSDVVDIAGAAVSTSTAQLGVNVVNIKGTASTGTAGYVGIDWSHVNAPTTTVSLSGTTVNAVTTVSSVLSLAAGALLPTELVVDSGPVVSATGTTVTYTPVKVTTPAALIGTTVVVYSDGGAQTRTGQPRIVTAASTAAGNVTITVDRAWDSNPTSSAPDLVALFAFGPADVQTIKSQTVTAAGGVTFPAATLASTMNITAGTVTTATNVTTVNGLAANTITAASIASGAMVAAVWDGAIAGHTTSGTFGGALNSAGSAGDPWNTALPGAYAAGTAGHIVGTALPDIAPGSTNGLLRGGTNAATTFATLTSTGAFTNNGVVDVAQTGDSFARIGATGSGLSSLAPAATALSTTQWTNALATNLGTTNTTVAANVDTTISSRAAAATALSTAVWTAPPTGFLAASFPASVASPTNITAGTITTVTNLTNAATAGDFTATMKTSLSAATPALSAAGNNAVADATLGRNIAGGSTGGRTVYQALAVLRNKVDTVSTPGSLLVYAVDDSTLLWSATLTTNPAAEPITIVDPA